MVSSSSVKRAVRSGGLDLARSRTLAKPWVPSDLSNSGVVIPSIPPLRNTSSDHAPVRPGATFISGPASNGGSSTRTWPAAATVERTRMTLGSLLCTAPVPSLGRRAAGKVTSPYLISRISFSLLRAAWSSLSMYVLVIFWISSSARRSSSSAIFLSLSSFFTASLPSRRILRMATR